jgi:K+-transporting ATPase c subunit
MWPFHRAQVAVDRALTQLLEYTENELCRRFEFHRGGPRLRHRDAGDAGDAGASSDSSLDPSLAPNSATNSVPNLATTVQLQTILPRVPLVFVQQLAKE